MQVEAQGIQPMFARLAGEGVDAVRIAEIAVSIWDGVAMALVPIIGQSGFAALFKRSVYLTCGTHPLLSVVNERSLSSTDELAMLQILLAQQVCDEAVAANAALLQNFHELLIALIGASLTERLLRPVWDIPTIVDAVQETMT